MGGVAILDGLPVNKKEVMGEVEVMSNVRKNAHVIFIFVTNENKKPGLAENFVVYEQRFQQV